MKTILTILFGLLLLLGMAPFLVCSQGSCPANPDGSCGAVTVCGTVKHLGHCQTITGHNGKKSCRCGAW